MNVPAFGRVYLDTNVFIQMIEGPASHSEPLLRLMAAADGKGPRLFTSELTLAELLVRPYALQQAALVDTYDGLMLTSSWLTVTPLERDVLWRAGVIRALYPAVKLPDAIHLSAALGLECSHFMTSDEGLRDSYRLTDNRYGVVRGGLDIKVVRPTAETLAAIGDEFA